MMTATRTPRNGAHRCTLDGPVMSLLLPSQWAERMWMNYEGSSRVAHARGDAVDGHEQRRFDALIVKSGAAEQLDLHQVDGIDVGIAHVDRPAQHRIGFERLTVAADFEHAHDRAAEPV